MEFVTCDRRRGTGGELIEVRGWQLSGAAHPDFTPYREDLQCVKSVVAKRRVESGELSKDPNHPQWGTVNIFNPANAGVHIHKVHLDLVQTFNGRRVING